MYDGFLPPLIETGNHSYFLDILFIGMGDFAFPEPLEIGDRIVFDDMIHYTMVKTTFFNGVAHPAIGVIHSDGNFEMLAQPGDYASYKAKLG